MAAPGEHEPFETGDVEHEPSELVNGTGKNARAVGVTTRHAHGVDDEDGEIDVPRVQPGRLTFPLGTEPPNDDAPTQEVNFAPRDATPPTVAPDA